MHARTQEILALLDHDAPTVQDAAQSLGMAVECELPKVAIRAAFALASDPDFPAPVKEFGRCMVRAIRARAHGKIGAACRLERVADRAIALAGRGFQW